MTNLERASRIIRQALVKVAVDALQPLSKGGNDGTLDFANILAAQTEVPVEQVVVFVKANVADLLSHLDRLAPYVEPQPESKPARTVMANGTARCLNCGRRVRVKATVISRHTFKAKGANLNVCSNSGADASTYATDYIGEIQ